MEDEENEHEVAPSKLDDDAVMESVEENVVTLKVDQDDEIDPALAEWLKIDEERPAAPTYVNDDSVTEADSDNADVTQPGEDEDDLDDWFQVKRPDEAAASESSNLPEKVWKILSYYKMPYTPIIGCWWHNDGRNGERNALWRGADLQAFVRDSTCDVQLFLYWLPFRCFYLDTVDNAVENNFIIKSNKHGDDINEK